MCGCTGTWKEGRISSRTPLSFAPSLQHFSCHNPKIVIQKKVEDHLSTACEKNLNFDERLENVQTNCNILVYVPHRPKCCIVLEANFL